jgi:Zn-dependent peptidase ImmA (M78 family)/transcriptional regulator with XRE-family HTH domain
MSQVFNGSELRLARIINNFSLDDVAEKVEKSKQYLSSLEAGKSFPTRELTEKLAQVLSVEPAFFAYGSPMIHEDQFHFRKKVSASVALKNSVIARGELVKRLSIYLEGKLKLPPVRIPEYPAENYRHEIERVAELCRDAWGLGKGPIENITRLAENIGAVVTSFKSMSKEIDALSLAAKRPVIVRSEAKESVCRQRFDISHEIGHLVLHQGVQTGDRVTESEANTFASAFLIPRSMMAKFFPRPKNSRLDWQSLSEFKTTWKVSKAAILYRALKLELISDVQYKSGVITLKRTGEAAGEKDDHLIPPEPPELLGKALSVLADRKSVFIDEIARDLNISARLLQEVIGFNASPKSEIIQRPSLRLVVNNM